MPKPRRQYPNQRVPNHILKQLEDARTSATLETARFGMPGEFLIGCEVNGAPWGSGPRSKPMTDDAFIKSKVKLHHETWIIHPLDVAIAWAKGETP